MSLPDISMGLGSIVYALTKSDGSLQQEEVQMVRKILTTEPYGDLALHTFFLQANCEESVEDAYAFGIRKLRLSLTQPRQQAKNYYYELLKKIASSHEGISIPEERIIQQFMTDL